MTHKLVYSMTLVAVFGLGHLSARWHAGVAHAQASQGDEKVAYLVVSPGSVEAPAERMAKYHEIAVPLAVQAGRKVLGAGTPGSTLHVLEGTWPYEERVGILSFRSMQALLDFWNSDTYQQARALRTEHEFVIAFEAAE